MAVTQISRIQNRRGLNQDLPQLAGAELGWSVDTRKLYIGNGTIAEGAPVAGITEILTQYTDLAALIGSYTFKGNVTEYTVETGSSILNPTVRSFQQKFDDFVNVRDFGALGNGVADDTASIRRAIEQIYKESENLLDPRTRRTIYIPAGTYITSNVISIPPNASLVGDGPNSTTISLQYGNLSVANICDSAFQSGSTIGSGGATLPDSIEISGIGFTNTAQEIQYPLLNIATSVGRLGVLVCWDQWFPEAARLMALAGADLLLYPTAIGWSPNDSPAEQARQREAWITVQRGHAIANGLPVLVANRCGHELDPETSSAVATAPGSAGLQFWGSSFAAGPQGELLAQASVAEEAVLLVDLDLDRSEAVRRWWPFLRDRRIDAYGELLKRWRT